MSFTKDVDSFQHENIQIINRSPFYIKIMLIPQILSNSQVYPSVICHFNLQVIFKICINFEKFVFVQYIFTLIFSRKSNIIHVYVTVHDEPSVKSHIANSCHRSISNNNPIHTSEKCTLGPIHSSSV